MSDSQPLVKVLSATLQSSLHGAGLQLALLFGSAARGELRAETALEHADMAPLIEAGAERWRRSVVARGGPRK